MASLYTPTVASAYDSTITLMRMGLSDELLRRLHINGTHYLFAAICLNLFFSIWHDSYKVSGVSWILSVFAYYLIAITAFLGFILP